MKRNTFSLLISFQPEKVSAIQSPQETVCSRPLRQRQSRHSFQIRLVLNNSFKTCTAFQASETPTGTLRLHPLTLTAPSPAPTSPRLRPLPHSRHHTPLAPPPSCYIPSCHSHPPPPHSSVLFHILVTISAGTRPRRWQSAGLSEHLRSLLRLSALSTFRWSHKLLPRRTEPISAQNASRFNQSIPTNLTLFLVFSSHTPENSRSALTRVGSLFGHLYKGQNCPTGSTERRDSDRAVSQEKQPIKILLP